MMPNDARNKLRNMGGIMASYPELMQAATQRYQTGGNVRVPSITNTQSPLRYIPTVPPMAQPGFGPRSSGYAPGLLETGTVDPRLMGPARRAPLSPTDAAMNAEIERGIMALRDQGPLTSGGGARNYMATPDMPFDRRVPAGPEAGMPGRSDARTLRTVMAGEGSESLPVTVDDLLSGSGASGFKLPEIKAVRPTDLESGPITPRAEALVPYDKIFGDIMGENDPVVSRGVEATEGPEATGLGAQKLSPEETERLARENAKTTFLPPEDRLTPELFAKVEEQLAKEMQPTGGGVERGATDGGAAGGGAGGGGRSGLKKRINEKLAIFQELFGTDDKEAAQDRAMSLAMAGLAMAAGTSPDALTNIARGAMAGAQMFSEGEARRRQRDDQLKTLAVESALAEQGAERDFAQRLILAQMNREVPELISETASSLETPLGTFDVFQPTLTGVRAGVAPVYSEQTKAAMQSAYTQKLDERDRLLGTINKTQQLLETSPDEITGLGGAVSRAKTAFGAAIPSGFKDALGILTSGEATPAQQYDVAMTHLAAELAPVLLGESGRTISDTDRARVAEALGFVVDRASIGGEPGITMTGFVQAATSDPRRLQEAMRQVETRLLGAYQPVDDFYRQTFPTEYAQIQEERSKPAEGQETGAGAEDLVEKWAGS